MPASGGALGQQRTNRQAVEDLLLFVALPAVLAPGNDSLPAVLAAGVAVVLLVLGAFEAWKRLQPEVATRRHRVTWLRRLAEAAVVAAVGALLSTVTVLAAGVDDGEDPVWTVASVLVALQVVLFLRWLWRDRRHPAGPRGMAS
jgi:NhaP-type Na+/H+ or K+/H+ antiporter